MAMFNDQSCPLIRKVVKDMGLGQKGYNKKRHKQFPFFICEQCSKFTKCKKQQKNYHLVCDKFKASKTLISVFTSSNGFIVVRTPQPKNKTMSEVNTVLAIHTVKAKKRHGTDKNFFSATPVQIESQKVYCWECKKEETIKRFWGVHEYFCKAGHKVDPSRTVQKCETCGKVRSYFREVIEWADNSFTTIHQCISCGSINDENYEPPKHWKILEESS
jgi:DNA-directed RNA polymerase subunit M/transcription elongation factor TFIIS